jgi:CRISPR-associated protein Csx14
MNCEKANITVPVDLTNPGQFFACCGLLELADRLWPGADVAGGFTTPRFEQSCFGIFANATFGIAELLKALLDCSRTPVDPYQPIMGSDSKPVKDAKKTKPVMLGEPISIRLSWWLDELAGKQTAFKTWSAHKTAEGLISDMACETCTDKVTDANVFLQRTGMTSRLGVDTRSSWNTLDEGFSPNDQNLPVDTYPATELLAAIGLETFRPARSGDGYVYACWSTPMPTVVTRAVASGSMYIQGITRYRFEIGTRGKFKFFTKASPLERSNHV